MRRPYRDSAWSDTRRSPDRYDRGLSPVVGKTLELGVGVLFVALLTTTLFGGLAPDYRDAVGAELGDRTLVAAAERTEAAVPDGAVGDQLVAGSEGVTIERRISLRLPTTIRDDPYRIAADPDANGSAVALHHPDPRIGGKIRLAVPNSTTVTGSVSSDSPSWILVTTTAGRLTVRLADDDAVGEVVIGDEAAAAPRAEATP